MIVIRDLIRKNYLLLVVLIGYLGFEIYSASHLFIWLDEAFSLKTTNDSLGEAVSRAVIFEGQPPVYFALLNLWRNIDDSIFFARLFSILCVSISIILVYLISVKHLQLRYPVFIAMLFAFNPMIIWAGLEIRGYALIVLFSALIIFLFLNTYLRRKEPGYKNKRVYYIVAALFAVNTQYYLSLLLLSNFIFLLLNKDWKTVRHYFIDMIIPFIAIIAYLPFLASQMKGHTGIEFELNFFQDSLPFILKRVKLYLFPLPRLVNVSNLWAYALLFLILTVSLKGKIKLVFTDLSRKNNYLVIISSILMLFFAILYLIVGPFNVYYNHTILLLLPLLLLLITIINYIPSGLVQRLLFFMILFVFVFHIRSIMPNPKRRSELIEIRNYIAENEGKDLPILFYRGEISIVYQFLGKEENKLFSVPVPIDLESPYNHCDWFIKDKGQLEDFFTQFQDDSPLWLISSELDGADIGLNQRLDCGINYGIFNTYLLKNYNINEERIFENKLKLRKIIQKK